ncbi:MAG TPA: hypothetical protein VHL10_07150 [Nitrososphaera sp.]|jgi:hypothetical protein|nr:hypothetical protein [Nitrososphaera sp.]
MSESLTEKIICCRCKQEIDGFKDHVTGVTGGYYEVHAGYWQAFANPGEKNVCDPCMFADERFIAVYGHHAGARDTVK